MSEAEARQVLTRFGALEKVWYCSQTDREMFRLPEGIWVMFAFFQDCRDAQSVRTLHCAKEMAIAKDNRGFEMINRIGLSSRGCLMISELD